jgi:hypothetical protein
MQIRRGYLGWGVFLILAGSIPLAVRAGYLTEAQVDRLWELWPLILVGIGVGLILSRTRFDFIGGLIVAATFGVMVGGLLTGRFGPIPTGACSGGTGDAAFAAQEGTIDASAGTVDIQLDCGDLSIEIAEGSGWRVAGADATGAGPDVTSRADGLTVRSHDGEGGPFDFLGKPAAWRIVLPEIPRLDLNVETNAGEATIDLDGATLGAFDLALNAGAVTVDLGSARQVETLDIGLNAGSMGLTLPNLSLTGTIEANAGSVRLCAPPGAALKLVTGESFVSSYDYDGHGLIHDGDTWTTPGFDTATVKIELQTEANAGTFVLDPEDGCG